MKRSIKLAAVLAVAVLPSFAANLENPLYAPKAGEIYSKTGAGVMYKVTDDTDALVAKSHDGATEFPIWRLSEDIGYGITDELSVRGQFGYTSNPDIDRAGLHIGRLGLNYRVLNNDIVWDIYADAHLAGLSKLTGEYGPTGFTYDNYSNGRYGAWLGTQVGKSWGKFSGAAFAEVLQTFANDNTEIDVTPMKTYAESGLAALGGSSTITTCMANPAAGACPAVLAAFNASPEAQMAYGMATMTDDVQIKLKSTTEYNFGLKGLYEIDSKWSVGGAFTYKFHAANEIDSVETEQDNAIATAVASGFEGSLDDEYNEYIFALSLANQLSDTVQVALYGEYTFDTADDGSQNGSDNKAEMGVRLNARF